MKISRFVVDRLLKTGQIPAAKLGNRYRVRTDDFLKWWDNQVKQEQKNILKNLVS
jgi:excisionase family DNA binding protein